MHYTDMSPLDEVRLVEFTGKGTARPEISARHWYSTFLGNTRDGTGKRARKAGMGDMDSIMAKPHDIEEYGPWQLRIAPMMGWTENA